MLLRETHLTFKQIAHEWARELDDAKKPGRLNRDEIFLNMVNGVWRGQFANLTIEQALRDDKDGRSYKPAPMPITREVLDKVVLVRQGARQRDPAASRWEFRTSLKLEDYDPQSLSVWVEPLTISKEDFDRWCDKQGHQRPQFWFGEQADARAVPPEPLITAAPRGRPGHDKPLKVRRGGWWREIRDEIKKHPLRTKIDVAREIAAREELSPEYVYREASRARTGR